MRSVVLALVLTLAGAVPAPAAPAPECAPGSITVLSDVTVDGQERLRELTLASEALRGQTKVRVLLPAGYAAAPEARFDVLFLLHGVGDDHASWTTRVDAAAITAPWPSIVVMPDGGRTPKAGWYSDWVSGEFCWESYHVGELLGFIDARYRTTGDAGRAIAGNSMGGFGALSYAARHPDRFVAAGSFSGLLDTARAGPAEGAAFPLASDRLGTPSDDVWGPFMNDEVTWRDHNPADLVGNLHQTLLWVRTGNGVPRAGDNATNVPVEAGVYLTNLSFTTEASQAGVAHTFSDRGFGTHEWHYWAEDLGLFLAFLNDNPLPVRGPFDYRTAEPAFEIYGWDFEAERAAKEFVVLDGVDATGFTATGSGWLHATSAAVFAPESCYRIDHSWTKPVAVDEQGAVRMHVIHDGLELQPAGPDGRLSFAVSLGDTHREQQDTVAGRLEAARGGPWHDTVTTVRIAPSTGCVVLPG